MHTITEDSGAAKGSLHRPAEAVPGVLLVNENASLQETTKALFSGTGWRCFTSQDTVSALCDIVDHRPLAVLVDSEAGPLDAWQFCALIKEHRQFGKILVLILERQNDVVSRARAEAAGADACLQMPFTAEDVLGELGRLQESRP